MALEGKLTESEVLVCWLQKEYDNAHYRALHLKQVIELVQENSGYFNLLFSVFPDFIEALKKDAGPVHG